MASYPGLPDNRLVIIDGSSPIDLTEEYKMVLLDGYELNPPEPILRSIDIPGAINGPLDLTEVVTGDVPFSSRKQTFSFAILYPENFETIKSELSALLHGRAFDYYITMDPIVTDVDDKTPLYYTYHGRFKITSAQKNNSLAVIQIEVIAEPYKLRDQMVYTVWPGDGLIFECHSGRMPVHPIIETTVPTVVKYEDVTLPLNVGTYRLNNVVFTKGINRLELSTIDLSSITWGDLKQGGKFPLTWTNTFTWDALHKEDGNYGPDEGSCIIYYDWKEL